MKFPALIGLTVALALFAGSCSRGGPPSNEPDGKTVMLNQIASSPKEGGPSALDDPKDPSLPPPLVDPSELISGGPPPDGIPPIDNPRFQKAAAVDWLADREPVLVLEIGDDRRAYPAQILIWHEIVNDTVNGIPVTVTYCPLCNSAVAFDRRVDGRTLDFGTSGLLYRSALVMYDRQTESLWAHFTGESIAGMLTGSQMAMYPVATVAWEDWRSSNPDGWVLSRETGADRDYGRNPYEAYDEPGARPFLFEGEIDDKLRPKARVVGIRTEGDAVTIPLDDLRRRRVIHTKVGDKEVVAWTKGGLGSALDSSDITKGRNVGATGVFHPVIDGRRLRFRADGTHFVDLQSGSRWNILGEAVSGSFRGQRLEPVEHLDTFWFAWSSYVPETRIVRK